MENLIKEYSFRKKRIMFKDNSIRTKKGNTKSKTPIGDPGGYLSVEEVKKVMNYCENERDRMLIYLLFATGRRISELLQLKPKNIQWDKQLIDWAILKQGYNYRALKPVDEFTLLQLKKYINNKPVGFDSYVFQSEYKEGKPYTRDWALKKVRKLVTEALNTEKIGSKYPHPHHFRHSFAVNYVVRHPSGDAIRQLQSHLGHKLISTTAFYLQFGQKEEIEALEKVMGGLFDDQKDPKKPSTTLPPEPKNLEPSN